MTDTRTALIEAEKLRVKALLASDLAALNELFDDRLSYIHASGFPDTKGGVIGNIEKGIVRFVSIEVGEQTIVEITPDVGLVSGPLSLTVNVHGKDNAMKLLVTCVWNRVGGSWKLIGFQSTVDAR